MDPLITIETVPIKIEYVEKERLSPSSTLQSAQLNISRDDKVMTIQSDPINIPVADTFEFTASNNWDNMTYTATAQYSSGGNLRMNVQMQASEDNSYQYQQFGRGIDNMIESIPSTKTNLTSNANAYRLENVQIDFDMSRLGSSSGSVDTSFLPPDLELKVVERPKVIIKYVGGPIYVPKSSDPNYDASQAIGPTYFPESADPNYDAEMTQVFDAKSKLDLRA